MHNNHSNFRIEQLQVKDAAPALQRWHDKKTFCELLVDSGCSHISKWALPNTWRVFVCMGFLRRLTPTWKRPWCKTIVDTYHRLQPSCSSRSTTAGWNVKWTCFSFACHCSYRYNTWIVLGYTSIIYPAKSSPRNRTTQHRSQGHGDTRSVTGGLQRFVLTWTGFWTPSCGNYRQWAPASNQKST